MIESITALLIALSMEYTGAYWQARKHMMPVCHWQRGVVTEEVVIENPETIYFERNE